MERTPFTSEVPDEDTEVTPERQRRPFEVLKDWLADRQRMLIEREDDEEDEDDSPEGGKKRRGIARALRGLFQKNVTRESIEGDEPAVVPERAFLGGVIEVEEPVVAEEHEETLPDLPEEPPVVRTAAEHPEVPAAVTAAEEVEDDDDHSVATPSTSAPTSAAASSVPPVPPHAIHTPGSMPSGGGDILSAPDPVSTEREPVIEHHHHNRRAALAALVIAERIDHHRDKKRKEQIKKVEKAQAEFKQKTDDRLKTLETPVERRPEPAKPAPVHREREVMPVISRHETPALKPEVATESRPQSVKEVLENRSLNRDKAPSLADLEHKPTREVEAVKDEDILVAAEKLATHAKEKGIAHEVFDERWHEIKDPDTTLGTAYAAKESAETVQAQQSSRSVSSMPTPPAPMFNPNTQQYPTNQPDQAPKTGLWVALVIGVVVSIALILSRI